MDRGAWWATVHGVIRNQTSLSVSHKHTVNSNSAGNNFSGNIRITSNEREVEE